MKTKKRVIAAFSAVLVLVPFFSFAMTAAEEKEARELDRRQNMAPAGYVRPEIKALNDDCFAFIAYYKEKPERLKVLLSRLTSKEIGLIKDFIAQDRKSFSLYFTGGSFVKGNTFVRDFRANPDRLKALLSGLNDDETKLVTQIVNAKAITYFNFED